MTQMHSIFVFPAPFSSETTLSNSFSLSPYFQIISSMPKFFIAINTVTMSTVLGFSLLILFHCANRVWQLEMMSSFIKFYFVMTNLLTN